MGCRSEVSRRSSSQTCLVALVALAGLGISLAPARSGRAELRPLVRDMLENLGDVNHIGEGVALEDFDTVAQAGKDLKARAQKLRLVDLESIGLDRSLDAEFRRYLSAQEKAADSILAAAEREDPSGALEGVERLYTTACLPCHKEFRERANLLSPSVLFMTTYLTAWQDMNRGLAIDDYTLVRRRAREIEAMGRVIAWDQVIQMTFGLTDPKERKGFRQILDRVSEHALQIEQAASEENGDRVSIAMREMWEKGCISCHDKFR